MEKFTFLYLIKKFDGKNRKCHNSPVVNGCGAVPSPPFSIFYKLHQISKIIFLCSKKKKFPGNVLTYSTYEVSPLKFVIVPRLRSIDSSINPLKRHPEVSFQSRKRSSLLSELAFYWIPFLLT